MREVTNFSLMRSNFSLILNHSPHLMDLEWQKERPRYEIGGTQKGLERLSSHLSPGFQPAWPRVFPRGALERSDVATRRDEQIKVSGLAQVSEDVQVGKRQPWSLTLPLPLMALLDQGESECPS